MGFVPEINYLVSCNTIFVQFKVDNCQTRMTTYWILDYKLLLLL